MALALEGTKVLDAVTVSCRHIHDCYSYLIELLRCYY